MLPPLLAHSGGGPLPPATPSRLLTEWTFDPVLVLGVLLITCLYLYGVRRLAERGDRWPLARGVSFLVLGLGSIVIATMSGLGAYDTTLFSVHMGQHMILSMVSPVFLALGAPVTLALRTLPGTGTSGPRGLLLRLLHSRLAKIVSSPVVTFPIFVGTLFVLYFTPLYEATLRSTALHELLHVHFVLVGCLFFWPLIGLDPVPNRLPYPLRMLVMVASLPFHAFLGIAIMSETSVIAHDWYAVLPNGAGDLLADQYLGGGLLWASGDLVGLLFMGVLAVQWMRADERLAAREDRRLDRLEAGQSSEEQQLAAYNAHLARLAEADARRF